MFLRIRIIFNVICFSSNDNKSSERMTPFLEGIRKWSKIWQKLPIIVRGKPNIPTSRRQVLPVIDLRQTRFHMEWPLAQQKWSRFLSVIITTNLLEGQQLIRCCNVWANCKPTSSCNTTSNKQLKKSPKLRDF